MSNRIGLGFLEAVVWTWVRRTTFNLDILAGVIDAGFARRHALSHNCYVTSF